MYVFVHIEKCGGSTLNYQLRRIFGLDHCDIIPRDKNSMKISESDLDDLFKLRPSVHSITGHSIRPCLDLGKYNDQFKYYCLFRNPIHRYISAFKHFVTSYHFPNDIDEWLKFDDQKNFQTKAIAGVSDIEAAKHILDDKIVLVGLMEEYNDFLVDINRLIPSFRYEEDYQIRNIATTRKGYIPVKVDIDKYHDKLCANNQLDIELYEYSKTVVIPKLRKSLVSNTPISAGILPDTPMRKFESNFNYKINLLYRNFIYKPYMGYTPFRQHRLPDYQKVSDDYLAMNKKNM